MKILIVLCTLAVATFGEIASSNKYDQHYEHHSQAVNSGKQAMEDKLAAIGVQYGNNYGSSGSQRLVTGCITCTERGASSAYTSSSRQSSSSSSQRQSSGGMSHGDYNGVGTVGHTDSRYTLDDDDVQTVVSPQFSSNSRYTSRNYEAEDMQQRQVPGDLSNIQAAAYRNQQMSHDDEDEDVQQTVDPGYVPSYSRTSYSRGESNQEASRTSTSSSLPTYSTSRVQGGSDSSRTGSDYSRTGSDYSRTGSGSSNYLSSRSQNREESITESSRTVTNVPTYITSGSQRSTQAGSGQTINLVVRPGTSTVLSVPVRTVSTAPLDQRTVFARTSESESSNTVSSSQHPTTSTFRVVYTPVRTQSSSTDRVHASSFDEQSRTGYQQPEKLTSYNSFNAQDGSTQTRLRADEIDSRPEPSRPAPITYGGSRVASTGSSTSSQTGSTQTRVTPALYPLTVEQARVTDDRRYPQQPSSTHVTSSRISQSEKDESRTQGSSYRPVYSTSYVPAAGGTGGSVYYTAVPTSRIQSQSQTSSGSQTQSQQQVGSGSSTQYQTQYRPVYTLVPARTVSTGSINSQNSGTQSRFNSNDDLQYFMTESERLARLQQQQVASGSSRNVVSSDVNRHSSSNDRLSQSRFSSASNDDLHALMSESERQARLQQQQVTGTSSSRNSFNSNSEANNKVVSTAADLDSFAANFVRSSNLANRNSEMDVDNGGSGVGAGGYQVRSWNRQSKWSSGSEYGTDGKPKTYSTLSTAEAEKYNINGAEAGYKAATSTLENDGKVSTYSIHS